MKFWKVNVDALKEGFSKKMIFSIKIIQKTRAIFIFLTTKISVSLFIFS